jgi:hypothetical protein
MPVRTQTTHIRRNALEWRTDDDAAFEIEGRLAAHGIDQQTINAENIVQAREFFSLFQELLEGAQCRRMSVLREIKLRRAKPYPPRSWPR